MEDNIGQFKKILDKNMGIRDFFNTAQEDMIVKAMKESYNLAVDKAIKDVQSRIEDNLGPDNGEFSEVVKDSLLAIKLK